MRRKDREITQIGEILRIVQGARYLHLGLFDGEAPYVVPLHFGYELTDGRLIFYMHSAREGHKLDLIRAHPQVCVELECGVEPISGGDVPCEYGAAFASVMGRGTAEIVSDQQEKLHGLALLMRHQTGRRFAMDAAMAAAVEIIKVTLPTYTAKVKPHPRQEAAPRNRETSPRREIPITAFDRVRIGQTENATAGTGCTVFVCREGMRAGLDVRGGGPASRESQLLHPLMAAQFVHAIVLGGGSAFGLGAADGVMRCLEERDIGYDVGVTKVPLVAQSDIFDLTVGDARVRPDAAMGYEAARLALDAPNYRDGGFGAGCGATVGKIRGMDHCMKSGIGSWAVQIGDLQVGAVAVVNALGDVHDWRTGQEVAGLLTEDRTDLRSTAEYMEGSVRAVDNKFTGNTTVAVVMTNGRFEKSQLCKIAGMAHAGLARSVRPVHTSADGDSIYAVSVGDVEADQDLVGILAAEAVSGAILRAAESAESAYGYPAARELRGRENR